MECVLLEIQFYGACVNHTAKISYRCQHAQSLFNAVYSLNHCRRIVVFFLLTQTAVVSSGSIAGNIFANVAGDAKSASLSDNVTATRREPTSATDHDDTLALSVFFSFLLLLFTFNTLEIVLTCIVLIGFYRASSYASAHLELVILSACPSLLLSVCHRRALWQNNIYAQQIVWYHTQKQSLYLMVHRYRRVT